MIKTVLKSVGLGLAISAASVHVASAQSSASDHQITMQQADIRAFIDDVAIVTGKTFIVDPRVQGNVTISSEQGLTQSQVFDVFKNVMRTHGYAVIGSGRNEYRITLLQGAAQDAPFVQNSGFAGQMATVIIRLDHADAAEAAKLIKPVMNNQGILTANAGGNILVITDFPENLSKARGIVAAMDKSTDVIETISLRSMSAADAETAIKAISGQRPKYRTTAVPGSNMLVLEGDAAEIARLRPIIAQMDNGGGFKRGAVSVVPLRFADGQAIVELLVSLLPAYTEAGQPPPTVAYEAGSNTIVISANPDTQAAMEQVIRQLDSRRPQVLVEAIIVEISDTVAQDLGVQLAIGGKNGSNIPLLSSNFIDLAPNVLSLTGALVGDSFGLADATQTTLQTTALNSVLGLDGGTIGAIGGNNDAVFTAILNAVAADDNSNILSTPFVTTLDNVPARFVVGQEIPIVSGETLTGTNLNPFRTFEREQVGIKLDVLPQISEGDVIRLEIIQEVSSISGAISSLSQDFVLNTREIATTVLADNGEIIVLGGLIQDDEQITIDKIPGLGDAPVIGRLFRSESKSRLRTNLMVFLRPTIIRNASDAAPLTQNSLLQMRAAELRQSGRINSKLDTVINGQLQNTEPSYDPEH